VFDGAPPEDFSGTWIGTYECTASDSYPSGAEPHGYLIATIAQTGADVTMTFPVGTGGLTGTASGDTLTADGTLWMGYPASVSLTISGTQISGTYETTAHSGTDVGDFSLTLVTSPPAQVRAGEWYGLLTDFYDSEGCPTECVLFSDIETPSTGEIVIDAEYMDLDDPGVVFEFPGVIAGNVFAVMLHMGTDVTYLSGVILSDEHLTGTYDSQWEDDGFIEYEWGEFEQRLSPGPQIDLTGQWQLTVQDVYGDSIDPQPRTFTVTCVQTGAVLTMTDAEANTYTGEVRGNMFVMFDDDEPFRVDGMLEGSQVSGTSEGEDNGDWYWGTFSGSPTGGAPPEDFSGTWTGTFECTASDSYPGSALPHGHLIATIQQTGSDVTVTFPIGTGGLDGTVSGDTLTAGGTLWTGRPASVSLTISGTHVTGTYQSGTVGDVSQGTLELDLTPGPPAQIQPGNWYGTVEDKYDSEGYPTHHVLFTNVETPSGSQVIMNCVLEDTGDPGEVFPLPGEIAGNVFMLMHADSNEFVYVTGVVEDDDHVSGTWEEADEDGFAWGEVEQRLSPGPQINLNGLWRISYQDVYADGPESGTLDLTFTQTGSSVSIVEMGATGEVRANMFVVVGHDGDGNPLRIDGELEGSVASGTYEGHDEHDRDDWWWGTYTAQRR